jgi:hypothetical protein
MRGRVVFGLRFADYFHHIGGITVQASHGFLVLAGVGEQLAGSAVEE